MTRTGYAPLRAEWLLARAAVLQARVSGAPTERALLESLASASKGEVIEPEDVGRLAERLASQVQTRERRDEQKVWEDMPLVWYVLGVILTLLTLEWVSRKLAGLP